MSNEIENAIVKNGIIYDAVSTLNMKISEISCKYCALQPCNAAYCRIFGSDVIFRKRIESKSNSKILSI